MPQDDHTSKRVRIRRLVAGSLGLAIAAVYLTLPDSGGTSREEALGDEPTDALERVEIRSIVPADPYPGSSITVSYAGARPGVPLHVYAGPRELDLLAMRPGQVVARLPRDAAEGPLKVRLAASPHGKEGAARSERSKPYFIRVKTPNLRKVFRNLVGGGALVALGIGLLARGVRGSLGLEVARTVLRATSRRSLAYAFGLLTGALAQSTTSAAGVLAALRASGVLPLVSAALAFVGAQLGATLAPLLVAGLMEPREGLIAIAIGALFIGFKADRRWLALGRLILGAGFVAFGLQVFRPALEPFVSDPVLLALADGLRADTPLDIAACSAIGTVLVAAMQGPAPLIVLILGVVQTTGHWDLTTALALLSGTGLGASIAALLTASAGSHARRLAQLHLALGALGTALSAVSAGAFAALVELLLGSTASSFTGLVRAPLDQLGAALALGFGSSQLVCALVLGAVAPRLRGLLGRTRRQRGDAHTDESALGDEARRRGLSLVIARQQRALDALGTLAQLGARSYGQRAEHTLVDARSCLEALVGSSFAGAARERQPACDDALGRTAFACLQLQHSLEGLLQRTERVTEARLVHAAHDDDSALPHPDERMLRELHALVAAGLDEVRSSLADALPFDLDRAREREIRINMLESRARLVLRETRRAPELVVQQLDTLQVIDAYEVVGNQLYRLAEAVSDTPQMMSA